MGQVLGTSKRQMFDMCIYNAVPWLAGGGLKNSALYSAA